MTLSKREKSLLAVLLTFIALFLFYKFIYLPKLAQIDAVDAEIAEDKDFQARLEKSVSSNEDIEASIHSMKVKVKEMNRLLPMRIYQEEIILYLEDLLGTYDITVENISFSTESIIDEALNETPTEDSVESMLNDYEEGKKPKSLEELKKVGEEIPEISDEEEILSIKQFDAVIDFSGKYLDLKDFVDKMESNNRLIGIHNLDVMSDEGSISGNMVVSFPFYEDGSLNKLLWEIENSYGKPDLFKLADASTYTYGYTPDLTEFNRSDFYLFLDPVESVLPTATFGKTPFNYTAIYNDANTKETIKLVLKKEDSGYSYRYENSVSTYPSKKDLFISFEPSNSKVILNVYVRSGEGYKPIPGAMLLIENETEFPLYIHVIGDNPEDPIFEYRSIKGDVRETRIP